MAMTSEMQSKIAEWRAKAREGTLTQAEMVEAIAALRQERVGASTVSATSRAKKATTAAKKNVDSNDLLNELDNL